MDRMKRDGIMNEDKQTNNTAAKTEVPDTEKEALTEEELETGERKIFCVYGKNSSLIRNRYV